jgi:hypothetical protein
MDWPGIVPVLYLKAQPVPRSTHSLPVKKTNHLTVYRGIIAVCSQIRTKHKYPVLTAQ